MQLYCILHSVCKVAFYLRSHYRRCQRFFGRSFLLRADFHTFFGVLTRAQSPGSLAKKFILHNFPAAAAEEEASSYYTVSSSPSSIHLVQFLPVSTIYYYFREVECRNTSLQSWSPPWELFRERERETTAKGGGEGKNNLFFEYSEMSPPPPQLFPPLFFATTFHFAAT